MNDGRTMYNARQTQGFTSSSARMMDTRGMRDVEHLGEVERDLRCRVNLEKTVIEQRAASLQRQALKLARQRAFLREERKRARKEEKQLNDDKEKLEHVKKVGGGGDRGDGDGQPHDATSYLPPASAHALQPSPPPQPLPPPPPSAAAVAARRCQTDWFPHKYLRGAGAPSERVRMRVGGQMFEVSKAVLCLDPTSLLAALCNGEPGRNFPRPAPSRPVPPRPVPPRPAPSRPVRPRPAPSRPVPPHSAAMDESACRSTPLREPPPSHSFPRPTPHARLID